MNPAAADLAMFYADWPAVDVLWTPKVGSPASGRAIHDHPGQVLLSDGVAQTEHALRYPAASFPGVKVGDVFTVEGANYTVATAPIATLDGLELTVELGRNGT